MKKTIALGVVFLFVMMSFTSISGVQIDKNIIQSSGRGNTLYVGGSGEGNYTKIQDAIDDASDGDTVFVYDDSSPYYEWNILIDKSINLIGENKDTTVIDGNNTDGHIIRISKDSVNISGFTIRNGSEGIYKEYYDWEYLTISNNIFLNCNYGIEGSYMVNSCVISNMFSDCDTSIYSIEGYYTRISDNIVYSTPEESYWGEITCIGYYNSVIANNTVTNYNEGGIGLYLDENGNTIIKNNTIIGQGCAISMDIGSSFNIISHNNIINNGLGIGFWWHSGFNKILNNNFINNEEDSYSWLANLRNVFDGNYWDKWIGLKFPRLGFLPYTRFIYENYIFWDFTIDWHPAKEPYNYTSTQGCGIE